MFRLPQTVPDSPRALVQVGGSPFDCAGLGSTGRTRMACKRPGVRVPLAPRADRAGRWPSATFPIGPDIYPGAEPSDPRD